MPRLLIYNVEANECVPEAKSILQKWKIFKEIRIYQNGKRKAWKLLQKNTSSMKNSDVNEILSVALIGLLFLLIMFIETLWKI